MLEKLTAGRLKLNKKSNLVFLLFIAFGILLVGRLFYLQIIRYDQYQLDTVNQYIRETKVKAKRGTIYDCNMKIMATSVTVERVFIAPNAIPDMTVAAYVETQVEDISKDDERKKARSELLSQFDNTALTVKEDIAGFLSKELGVDRDEILQKAAKTKRADETIKKQVPLEITAELKKKVAAKAYGRFIYFAEESKRYYPYDSLACHVLGFCGTDGNGLSGIEAYYDSLLTGEDGKIVYARDGKGNEMSTKYESYVDATDGADVMLTIDWTCQSILEKYLEEAYEETHAQNRVCGIIMRVEDGEILGMATKEDFDLNDPYTLDAASLAKLNAFEGSEEEKNAYYKDLLYELWKNKAVTELYEPGSTFKILTSAMVLEENLVTATERFTCTGSITIPGLDKPIHCHKTAPGHGTQTFAEALGNSCNPVFVIMSQRLGKELFYKYYKAFGYTETTGVDIAGEAKNLFFNLDSYSSVDVACAAFGQNFKVTPISHLRAVCAVANGGYLVTPHVLKATLDEDGNVVESYSTEPKRQVISTENCKVLWDYLYKSVEEGGNRNAGVQGYKVAAKTGTSTKTEKSNDYKKYYVGSCVAFAPADDPEIAIIVLIDEPVGSYYGSLIAAPCVSKILSEVLPYLGVEAAYTQDEIQAKGSSVPDYSGKSLLYASSDLESRGFKAKVIGNGTNIVSQSPAYGTNLTRGAVVVLYTEGEKEANVKVPNLLGLTPAQANKALVNAGLNIALSNGTLNTLQDATVSRQSIAEGTMVAPGTVVTVDFKYTKNITE